MEDTRRARVQADQGAPGAPRQAGVRASLEQALAGSSEQPPIRRVKMAGKSKPVGL